MHGFSRTLTLMLTGVALWGSGASPAVPLHVYLTYSGNPATSIDINVIMSRRVPAVEVYYDTSPRNADTVAYARHVPAAYCRTILEIYDGRTLYVATLTDLQPGTVYYFVAGDEKNGYTKERAFRTLPGRGAPLRFVVGGDLGTSPRTEKLLRLAGRQNPDFAVIGGDIAYCNGLFAENKDWDDWLTNWDKYMVAEGTRAVPIVAAIGNHEVNHYESDNPELRSPYYVSLFGRQGAAIYYSRQFSDAVVFFVLDSGHLNPYDGAQTAWLAQELEKYKGVQYKFAAYHVPLYPTHRPYEGENSKSGRVHWGPLFDAYHLTVGFEHHDHVFKRSKPLKGNKIAEGGTVYVGDGAFGVDPRTIDPTPRWYNEKEGRIAHFWVVDASPNGLSLTALDEDGTTVDAFPLP